MLSRREEILAQKSWLVVGEVDSTRLSWSEPALTRIAGLIDNHSSTWHPASAVTLHVGDSVTKFA